MTVKYLLLVGLLACPGMAAEPPSKRSISAIVSEAKGNTGRIRSKALDEIANKEPESAQEMEDITSALKTNDAGVQAASLKALRRVKPTARHLKSQADSMIDDSLEQIQLGGIIVAAKIQAKELAPKIRGRLAQRPRFKIRKNDFGGIKQKQLQFAEEAAKALVDLDDFESIDELLSRDEVMAISNFGGPLVARFGAKALPKAVLLARQKDTSRSDGGRSVISSMQDPAAIPALIELGKDRDNDIVSAAVLALSQIPTETAQDKANVESALTENASSKDRFVRGPAYDGLLRLNPKKHLPAALEVMKTDDSARLDILHAIAKHQVKEAIPALEAFIRADELKEPNWTVNRKVAAQTIFKLTGKRVPYLGIEKDSRIYADPYDPSKR